MRIAEGVPADRGAVVDKGREGHEAGVGLGDIGEAEGVGDGLDDVRGFEVGAGDKRRRGAGWLWRGLRLEQDRINDRGRKQLGEDAGASSGVLCSDERGGLHMPSWAGRDRRVKQSGGEDAVSRWHGDGR